MDLKEAIAEWRSHPVTEAFRRHLLSRRQSLMEDWAAGVFQADTEAATHALSAAAVGEAQALQRLHNFDADDLREVWKE